MPVHDETSQRLFVAAELSAGADVAVSPEQANYLINVMRLRTGDGIRLFNGRDGEWRSELTAISKRGCMLTVVDRVRPQVSGPDVDYLFAPLKAGRLDYMVQKATELGVRRLCPVFTRHTVPDRVKIERLAANAIEAAEQCGVLWVPEVQEPVKLEHALRHFEPGRRLIWADEGAAAGNPITCLQGITPGPLAVLIGPEGGFHADERARLAALPFATAVSLGPRIMRADTAAVALLTLVNAVLGDWQ